MRFSRPAVAVVAALALGSVSGPAASSSEPRAAAGSPGSAGASVVLDRDANYSRFDVATDRAGTSYVGWISSHPGDDLFSQVHVCVLPVGATACAGGIQTIDALEKVTAEQLFVVASDDQATLVWHHLSGDASTDDPMQDRIAAAQVVDGHLMPGTDVASAPSESTLMAVNAGPRGISAALVSGPDDDARTVYYYDALSTSTPASPTTLRAPYAVGNVQLADDGTSSVMLIDQYAAVTAPVRVAWKPSGSGAWSSFASVAGTTTDHNTARMTTTSRGIRLLATARDTKKGGEQSVVASWRSTAHAFSKPVPALVGQSCATGGRDVATDASGRMSSVAIGCDTLAIGNHQTGAAGALTQFRTGLSVTGVDAQIATNPSGRGWVVWIATGHSALVARPILLPALTSPVTTSSRAGRLTLTAPVSCLPLVNTTLEVTAKAAKGWRLQSTSVTLGNQKIYRTIPARALKPGRSYLLTAKATYLKHGVHQTMSKSARFTTCSTP
ncbi:hypothetical protein [Nocardioides plantarum]|uniref:Fibronectin type-III domain-containing protein n=1 Tax=Nocardioides plantarum TaxID=29299 RepID=A0ABV5KF39_9ACTN|nr:hypothetical protein [Nocardioides plantarum]